MNPQALGRGIRSVTLSNFLDLRNISLVLECPVMWIYCSLDDIPLSSLLFAKDLARKESDECAFLPHTRKNGKPKHIHGNNITRNF